MKVLLENRIKELKGTIRRFEMKKDLTPNEREFIMESRKVLYINKIWLKRFQ